MSEPRERDTREGRSDLEVDLGVTDDLVWPRADPDAPRRTDQGQASDAETDDGPVGGGPSGDEFEPDDRASESDEPV